MVDILFELEEARKVAGPAVMAAAEAEAKIVLYKSDLSLAKDNLAHELVGATATAMAHESVTGGKNAESRKAALDVLLENNRNVADRKLAVSITEGELAEAEMVSERTKAAAKVALLNLSAYQSMAAVIAALGDASG